MTYKSHIYAKNGPCILFFLISQASVTISKCNKEIAIDLAELKYCMYISKGILEGTLHIHQDERQLKWLTS